MSLKSYCEKEGKDYLLREWDSEKNAPLTPDTVAHTSTVPVWWRCEQGHVWRTQVKSRAVTKSGCPHCLSQRMEAQRTQKLANFKQAKNIQEERT